MNSTLSLGTGRVGVGGTISEEKTSALRDPVVPPQGLTWGTSSPLHGDTCTAFTMALILTRKSRKQSEYLEAGF